MVDELILVLGPESSGTRLCKRFFLGNGYRGGGSEEDDWHGELWTGSGALPEGAAEGKVVWRSSFPMGCAWPEMKLLTERIVKECERMPKVLVMTRDWYAISSSNKALGRDPSYDRIRAAYENIFSEGHAWWRMVSYEALVARGASYLGALTGLTLVDPPDLVLRDGNAKYYAPAGEETDR